MNLTAIDLGQRAPSDAFAEISTKPSTLRQKCIAAGLTPWSGSQWRRRHPDSTLSDDEVVALMLANKRKGWSREQYATLRKLINEGKGSEEIAEAMGKKRTQVVRAAKRLGLSRSRTIAPERAERLRRIIADCLDQGMTQTGIARHLDSIGETVSRAWIGEQIKAMGAAYTRLAAQNYARHQAAQARRQGCFAPGQEVAA